MLRGQSWWGCLLQAHSIAFLVEWSKVRRKIQRGQQVEGSNTILTHRCIWRACRYNSKPCWEIDVPASHNGCNFDRRLLPTWTCRSRSFSALLSSLTLRRQACFLGYRHEPDLRRSFWWSTTTLRNLHWWVVLCLCSHQALHRNINRTAW